MGIEKIVSAFFLTVPLWAGSLRETVSSQPGFEYFYNLEYDRAMAVFLEQVQQNPGSADNYNHVAQTVLYKEMYKAGMLSSDFLGARSFVHQPKLKLTDAEENQFQEALGRAFEIATEKLAMNPDDTGALYSIGVSYGLRANYDFVVKKAWKEALHNATEARKAHHRVTELKENFIDAKLTQGVYDYVVGSLPFGLKMLGFLAGFHGDKQRGIRTLEEVAEHGTMNRVDAMVLLAGLYLREHRPTEAIPVLTELTQTFPQNPSLKIELEKAESEKK
jgi:tetratricopeptide (TPR) repeat protein